jgi:hypothetical protein
LEAKVNRLIAGCFAALLAGCASTGPASVPLVWKPTTSTTTAGVTDLTGRAQDKLRIEVTDARSDPNVIGRNVEKLPPRKVTTPDSVAAFVNEHLGQLMSGTGVTQIDSAGTLNLKAEILQFFVEEAQTYKGSVRLKVTLTNSSGVPVWSGITTGTSTRFGRSFRPENYYETLSNSLVDATRNLMQNAAFRSALESAS